MVLGIAIEYYVKNFFVLKLAVANALVLVTADMNIKVQGNLKLQPRRHTDTLKYFSTPDVSNDSFFM